MTTEPLFNEAVFNESILESFAEGLECTCDEAATILFFALCMNSDY